MVPIRYIPQKKLAGEVAAAVKRARKDILATDNFQGGLLPQVYASALSARLATGKVICRRVAFSARKPTSKQSQILAAFPGTSRVLVANHPGQRLIIIDKTRLFLSNDNAQIPIAYETKDKKLIMQILRYFEQAWKRAQPLKSPRC